MAQQYFYNWTRELYDDYHKPKGGLEVMSVYSCKKRAA